MNIQSEPKTTTMERSVQSAPAFAAQVQPGELSYTVRVQVTYAIS